jgi:hypothetical protein
MMVGASDGDDRRRLRGVAAPPQTLEALVRDELRGPVHEIVRRLVPELVAEALNGAAPAPVTAVGPNGATVAPSTRVRKTCERELPLERFAKHRHECKSCRNARYPRTRRARATLKASTPVVAGDEEPPYTDAGESGPGT